METINREQCKSLAEMDGEGGEPSMVAVGRCEQHSDDPVKQVWKLKNVEGKEFPRKKVTGNTPNARAEGDASDYCQGHRGNAVLPSEHAVAGHHAFGWLKGLQQRQAVYGAAQPRKVRGGRRGGLGLNPFFSTCRNKSSKCRKTGHLPSDIFRGRFVYCGWR